ncbi:MAG: hypothetical protein V1772_05310 [Chloroflexota bacterium]
MTRRWLCMALLVVTVLAMSATPVSADPAPDPRADVLLSAEIPQGEAQPEAELAPLILVQATSWPIASDVQPGHLYMLTIANLTPWRIPALALLDRYLPVGSEQPEVIQGWFPEMIEPKASVSKAFAIEALWPEACHQLELSLADGLGIVLMDCNPPSATTVWSIALSDEMRAYLDQSPLTGAEPSGRSKIGLHVTRNGDPEIMKFIIAAQPAVVAAVGDLGWLAEVKAVSPGTMTLGRVIEGRQAFEGDPAQQARAFVGALAETYRLNLGVDYWLGWNEPVIDEIWQMQWYAAFEAERIVAMAELGLKTAIGSFSTGTPEPLEFGAFLPAIRVAKQHGAVLALHEYSAPTMRDGVGAGLPGIAGREGFGALTLRYRYWYEHYLRPNDLIIPLAITEAGVDGGVLRVQGLNLGGWRDFERGSVPPDMASQTAQTYLDELSWYDDQLRRDPYVVGMAIFNVGDEAGRWDSFDVTDLLPQLQESMAAKH